jgi:hypothetical protein
VFFAQQPLGDLRTKILIAPGLVVRRRISLSLAYILELGLGLTRLQQPYQIARKMLLQHVLVSRSNHLQPTQT